VGIVSNTLLLLSAPPLLAVPEPPLLVVEELYPGRMELMASSTGANFQIKIPDTANTIINNIIRGHVQQELFSSSFGSLLLLEAIIASIISAVSAVVSVVVVVVVEVVPQFRCNERSDADDNRISII
jgi:hypothetical protein